MDKNSYLCRGYFFPKDLGAFFVGGLDVFLGLLDRLGK